MESSAVRVLFRSIMKGQQPPPRDLDIINLMYPITMEELSSPVRNRGCMERSCVWPLDSLLKEAQEQARKGPLKQGELMSSIYTCRMCAEDTKFARRSYHDFYFDRKLDYLIRAAKNKYMKTFSQEELNKNPRAKDRALKAFKQCKLFIHRGGAVMLEYKKKLPDGINITYRTLVYQHNLSFSRQLHFNPKDYSKNVSALKIAQSLAEGSVGDRIDHGFEAVSLCYSKKYQQKLQRLLSDWILQHLVQHTDAKRKEELFAAKIVLSTSLLSRKNVEMILFYPRWNLTQIYTFDQCEDILNSEAILVSKLQDQRVLLYTEDYTYIIKLQRINLKPKQVNLKRQVDIKAQNGENILTLNTNAQVKYKKQVESYHKCPEGYLKFASVRPTIEHPILIQNPKDHNEVYVMGGIVQGLPSNAVYRLQGKEWVQQKEQVRCQGSILVAIIQGDQIFVMGIVEVGKKQKDQIYRIFLHEIDIVDGVLKVREMHQLCQAKSNMLLPLRTKQNLYILMDLTKKETGLWLDLAKKQVVRGPPMKDQITKFLRQVYDSRNQKCILQSYPTCSVTYNQVTYNLLSASIAKDTFKILYGCGNQWRLSDLSQHLLRD